MVSLLLSGKRALGEIRFMFRIWIKLIKENHLVKDITVCDDSSDTRTHKVMNAIDKACYEMDLSKPIWLESVVKDFQLHAKCRFTRDAFIEDVPFDYMEIQVIEEDY
jgi:hypothetical protein